MSCEVYLERKQGWCEWTLCTCSTGVVYVSYKHLQTVLLQPLTLMRHIPSDLTTELWWIGERFWSKTKNENKNIINLLLLHDLLLIPPSSFWFATTCAAHRAGFFSSFFFFFFFFRQDCVHAQADRKKRQAWTSGAVFLTLRVNNQILTHRPI